MALPSLPTLRAMHPPSASLAAPSLPSLHHLAIASQISSSYRLPSAEFSATTPATTSPGSFTTHAHDVYHTTGYQRAVLRHISPSEGTRPPMLPFLAVQQSRAVSPPSLSHPHHHHHHHHSHESFATKHEPQYYPAAKRQDVSAVRARAPVCDQHHAFAATAASYQDDPAYYGGGGYPIHPQSSLSSQYQQRHPVTPQSDDSQHAADPEATRLSKQARRKEQCRVNQANYRKRKRAHEKQLSTVIKSLEREIQQLNSRRHALVQLAQASDAGAEGAIEGSPEQDIAAFYFAMQGSRSEHAKEAASHRSVGDGITALLNMQQEEFASIRDQLQQWALYRDCFDSFDLTAVSTERLMAGDLVIVKILADLRICISSKGVKGWKDAKRACLAGRTLKCSVQQRFEFHRQEQTVTRVTSEVDWVSELAASAHLGSRQALELLAELSKDEDSKQ